MEKLPNSIYNLEFNNKQRLFHFNNLTSDDRKGWYSLGIYSVDDCVAFCNFMDKKYVDGRKSGILPELKIVSLELNLFIELKKYSRKLSGRI